MEELDGQIDRILFRNDESGYSVFNVKVKEISNFVTVTGTVASINDGELVVADGEWTNDPKYGRQFKASHIRTSSPDTLEGIDRKAVDALALVSQQNANLEIKGGYFDKSLIPVYNANGELVLDKEEFPRPETTLEGLSQLKASFESLADYPLDEEGTTFRKLVLQKYPDLEINHVHHAGNSSGVVDGAAALLLASPDYAKANGMKPRAKIKAMANMGDSPTLMLNAPVPAARKVLEKANLSINDIDLFEVNEAFSVVTEKFIRDLNIDREKINVNGGAMALGHPIGATGSILVLSLIHI